MFYSDAENVMTPNRAKLIQRRLAASKAIRARQQAAAQAKATGVLPVGHPSHVVEEGVVAGDFLAGILFADGAVHIFNRGAQMHSNYAANVGRPGVECGCAGGDDGWGFYLDEDDYSLQPYYVPEPFRAGVAEVVKALLASFPAPEPKKPWKCYRCRDWVDADYDYCCGTTRQDSDWFFHRDAAISCSDCGSAAVVDASGRCGNCAPADGLTRYQRAARKAQAGRTAEQRSASARKAVETRRRNAARKAAAR
jgi:hypothetical protein